MLKSTKMLLDEYMNSEDRKHGIRLGQYFVIHYYGGNIPELFYCEDTNESLNSINRILWNFQYLNYLPPRVN